MKKKTQMSDKHLDRGGGKHFKCEGKEQPEGLKDREAGKEDG